MEWQQRAFRGKIVARSVGRCRAASLTSTVQICTGLGGPAGPFGSWTAGPAPFSIPLEIIC